MNKISYFFWQTNSEAHRAERLTQLSGVFLAKVLNGYFLSLMLYNVSNNGGRCPAKCILLKGATTTETINYISHWVIKIVYSLSRYLDWNRDHSGHRE